MIKAFLIVTLTVISSTLIAQGWKFDKISYYYGATKKTVLDTSVKGSIVLMIASKSLFFIENGELSYTVFNAAESRYRTDNYFEYYLYNYSTKEPKVTININYNLREAGNSYGELVFSIGKNSKTFYITQQDSIYSPKEFFTLADTSLYNLHFEWTKILENSKGEVSFIQDKKLPDISGIIKVWEKSLLPTYLYKKITYKNVVCKTLVRVNCNNKELLFEKVYYYDSKGNVINGADAIYDKWETIIPETIGETMLNNICKLFNK